VKISIVGIVYVGLVTKICFAEGVTDGPRVDADKTNNENPYRDVITVYEPG
jgi:UDP-glucose 6-dehydrogenase